MCGWTVNGPLKENTGGAADRERPVLTVNRVSVVNLDEFWQQQFKIDFLENRLDEQNAWMNRMWASQVGGEDASEEVGDRTQLVQVIWACKKKKKNRPWSKTLPNNKPPISRLA